MGNVKLIPTKGLTKDLINGYGILNGAKCFDKDGLQNYLLLQPVFKYFQTFTGTDRIFAWQSIRLSERSSKTPITSGNSFTLKLSFIYIERIGPRFIGNCLIQDNVSFTHRNVVNLFIVY